MSNPWREFLDLLPFARTTIAQVAAVNADGTTTVEYPNGQQLVVRGQGVSVGAYAFVKDGGLRGEASAGAAPLDLEV